MQKKNLKKLSDLIGECYLTMAGQGKEDNIWNKAFEALITCVQEERSKNGNFAMELYKVGGETDYICDIDGWLEDYFDILDMLQCG